MITSYDINVDNDIIAANLSRIGNQIFKLLPMREEGDEYRKPLQTLIVELLGMNYLFPEQPKLFSLVCKLQGLDCEEEIEFFLYRRTIFEACSLTSELKSYVLRESE